MPETKIIVGTNGTGWGHTVRGREFIEHLQREAEIITVVSGKSDGSPATNDSSHLEFQGLSWKYKKSGIDFSHAALQILRLPQLRADRIKLAELIREIEPIGVWADFEFVTCGGASKYKKSMRVGDKPIFVQRVDHHAAFLSNYVPRPPWSITHPPTEWFLRNFCKADRYEGFHFQKYPTGRSDLTINTPIIQGKIRELVATHQICDRGHILCYLPGYDINQLVDLFKPYTNLYWIIYHKEVSNAFSPSSYIIFKPTGFTSEYLADLSGCHAALITTGFQLPSELLYMKKFFIGTPQRGQPEQHYNAAALKGLGIPIIRRLNKDSMKRVVSLISNSDNVLPAICNGNMDETYPDDSVRIVREFIERCKAIQKR